MLDKHIIKNVFFSLITMGAVSLSMLIILAAITYQWKWQAPQAQVGITLTYIVSGLAGGLVSGILKNRGLIGGVILGTMYMAILLVLSIMVSGNRNWDMGQIFLIWILISCSSVLGVFLGNALCKKD